MPRGGPMPWARWRFSLATQAVRRRDNIASRKLPSTSKRSGSRKCPALQPALELCNQRYNPVGGSLSGTLKLLYRMVRAATHGSRCTCSATSIEEVSATRRRGNST